MRQRIAGLTLLSLLLTPAMAQANGAPSRRDMQGHWAQPIFESGITAGWIHGFPDGSLRPDAPISRGEFFKILGVAMQTKPAPGWAPFVELDHWSIAQGWIPAAVGAGLVEPSDYAGFRLEPDKPITRQEMILAAVRATGLEGLAIAGKAPALEAAAPFQVADLDAVPQWLHPWASLAMAEGLIHGMPDHSLRVQAGASRAEALVVISRIVDKLTLHLTASKNSLHGQQYAAGEPLWSEAGSDGFHPLIQSVYAGRPEGQPVNPLTGHQSYTLPEYAREIQLLPAPNGRAWVRYTADGATQAETFDVFALLEGGEIKVVRSKPFQADQFQSGLAVTAEGALLLQDGQTITRLQPDGRTQVLAADLPLRTPLIDAQGNLWGITSDSTQLARVTPAGEVSRIALPVTPFGQSIIGSIPTPDGGLWLIRWDQEQRQTDAIRIKDGAVAETLLLMPTRTHGNDAMPVRIGPAQAGSVWIARQTQTGPTTWDSTALYSFDLATGAVRPALAPTSVKGPLKLAGTNNQGALLIDADGRYWTATPQASSGQ